MIKRISFLALLFSLALALDASEAGKRLPNILYCLADDWSWPHGGAYGDTMARTPNFDRVCREGTVFTRAYTTPSCTPSRAGMLTGRAIHQLEEGAHLFSFLPNKFAVYPDLLEKSGYFVGFTRKGWSPGSFQPGGWKRNPAGPNFTNFQAFYEQRPKDKPFCFWFGSTDPHRAYEAGAGIKQGYDPAKVKVPAAWPDTPEVRSDICDYYSRVERYDRDVGELIRFLESKGELENTIIVMAGDNGWPFPRAKANLYDMGTHVPLAIRWPGVARPGQVVDAFVHLTDLAPTFLDAAGLKPLPEMTGRSLVGLLKGKKDSGRDRVFVERERHAFVRNGNLSYPSRAIRTKDFLYIWNFRPDRWPAGDPDFVQAVGPFGDCDTGPTKKVILAHRSEPGFEKYFKLSFDRRPAEELYDLRKDPSELNNVASKPEYEKTRKKMHAELEGWLRKTKDPRVLHDDDHWDASPYYGKTFKTE